MIPILPNKELPENPCGVSSILSRTSSIAKALSKECISKIWHRRRLILKFMLCISLKGKRRHFLEVGREGEWARIFCLGDKALASILKLPA